MVQEITIVVRIRFVHIRLPNTTLEPTRLARSVGRECPGFLVFCGRVAQLLSVRRHIKDEDRACRSLSMTLKQYLDNKPFVRARRGLGHESDWLEFCSLELRGAVLFVFDPGMLPGETEGCKVALSPGRFSISAKVITYWKDSRISRLRVSPFGTRPIVGKRLGSAATDIGFIGMSDYAAYIAAWERDKIAFQKSVSNEIPGSGRCDVVKLGADPGVEVPFVESGFGDGRYFIYALLDGETRVGAEVVFIRSEKPYPFL
jgi:hypothetical protein